MFETAEEKWLKIYKGYTVGMFWVYLLAGIVLCFMGWSDFFGCWFFCCICPFGNQYVCDQDDGRYCDNSEM